MARVFIASDSLGLAQSAAAAVKAAGHLIVSTWHADDAPPDDPRGYGFTVIRATQEIEGANVVVHVGRGVRVATLGGSYWLVGYAVRAMCRVVMFNAAADEFARHPHHEHVADLAALLALLATVEDRNASKH